MKLLAIRAPVGGEPMESFTLTFDLKQCVMMQYRIWTVL